MDINNFNRNLYESNFMIFYIFDKNCNLEEVMNNGVRNYSLNGLNALQNIVRNDTITDIVDITDYCNKNNINKFSIAIATIPDEVYSYIMELTKEEFDNYIKMNENDEDDENRKINSKLLCSTEEVGWFLTAGCKNDDNFPLHEYILPPELIYGILHYDGKYSFTENPKYYLNLVNKIDFLKAFKKVILTNGHTSHLNYSNEEYPFNDILSLAKKQF